jgi:type IV secretory pathway VirB2 component (pilin)
VEAGLSVESNICAGSLWLLLSVINAGLAQGKGRSGMVWWLWSLLFGPLATLIVVIRPRSDS